MTAGDSCLQCGQPLALSTEDIPKPHYGRLVCAHGHHAAWVAAPMTYERSRGYVMPIGKYRGKTIAEIGDEMDPSYLQWAANNMPKSIARAIERFAAGP